MHVFVLITVHHQRNAPCLQLPPPSPSFTLFPLSSGPEVHSDKTHSGFCQFYHLFQNSPSVNPARPQLVYSKSLLTHCSYRRTLKCDPAQPTACTSRRATRSTAPSEAATCTRRVTGWCSDKVLCFERFTLDIMLLFCKATEDNVG